MDLRHFIRVYVVKFFKSFIHIQKHGFTLVELVIVIAIIGILASLSVPKFIDMSGAAKVSATKAGLGSLRSLLAVRYAASATGGATASFPASLVASDFGGSNSPKNALNSQTAVTALTTTTSYTSTHSGAGYWYVTNATAPDYGKAGAYSDPTGTTNTSDY